MNRRAILFGLNYEGTSASLQGCENDAHNMAEFLTRQHRFVCDVRIGATATTASAILDALVDLAVASFDEALDVVWIHYSGHGTSIAGFSDNELDGFDECLVPSDFRLIPDDYISRVLYYFNPRTRIVFVADCCHSGTISDLPFTWTTSASADSADEQPPLVENANEREAVAGRRILAISGCRDDQTSADALLQDPMEACSTHKEYSGAMTTYLLQALQREPGLQIDVFKLVRTLSEHLERDGFSQRPRLASCHDVRASRALF
jgi:hypothetical protein